MNQLTFGQHLQCLYLHSVYVLCFISYFLLEYVMMTKVVEIWLFSTYLRVFSTALLKTMQIYVKMNFVWVIRGHHPDVVIKVTNEGNSFTFGIWPLIISLKIKIDQITVISMILCRSKTRWSKIALHIEMWWGVFNLPTKWRQGQFLGKFFSWQHPNNLFLLS